MQTQAINNIKTQSSYMASSRFSSSDDAYENFDAFFIPPPIRQVMDAEYYFAVELMGFWEMTASIQHGNNDYPGYKPAEGIKHLELLAKKIQAAISKAKNIRGCPLFLSGDLYKDKGKTLYLIAKNAEFIKDQKLSESSYNQAAKDYENARDLFAAQNNSYEEADCIRLLAILHDQRRSTKSLVIPELEKVIHQITAPLRDHSYSSAFKIIAHFFEFVFTFAFLNVPEFIGDHFLHWKINLKPIFGKKVGKFVGKAITKTGGKLLGIICGYSFSLFILNNVVKRFINWLVTDSSLPGWPRFVSVDLLRFFIAKEKLIDCFDSKIKATYDLKKAYQNNKVNKEKIQNARKQIRFYLEQLKELLGEKSDRYQFLEQYVKDDEY